MGKGIKNGENPNEQTEPNDYSGGGGAGASNLPKKPKTPWIIAGAILTAIIIAIILIF